MNREDFCREADTTKWSKDNKILLKCLQTKDVQTTSHKKIKIRRIGV